MSGQVFVIPTRQRTDVLFQSSTPLGAGASFTSRIARVDGYNQVSIIAVSDQPFTIVVEEAAALTPTLAEPEQLLRPVPQEPPLPLPNPEPEADPPPIGVGEFVGTQAAISSTLVAGQQQIVVRIQPVGVFMRMTIAPSGAGQTVLSFAALGIPLP